MTVSGPADPLCAVRLSQVSDRERARLIEAYRTQVYEPAFPDTSIREDPQYWADLLGAAEYPPPPQPQIEVVLLVDAEAVVAGVTVEHYRTARSGLLTYISVTPHWRGKGVGRRLVAAARDALDAMADADTPMFAETERLEDAARDALDAMADADTPMFAETERLEDAANVEEAAETVLRQTRLAGLGARLVAFDYVMPPLRPDSEPHRLHLMLFDPQRQWTHIEAARVAALMRELAAALGADLDASADTASMMEALAEAGPLALEPLPAAREGRS